jgi:DNA helicase-4
MMKYTTAHRSKGLEADYVIIIGLRSGELGFPCQITDDPILNLVLAREDLTANAEERRLFYVSITRARKHVYLVVDDRHGTSTFASEIQRDGYEINVVGNNGEDPSCPLCETGKIVLRKGKYGEFHSCSNYPYCEYKEG